MHDHVLHKLHIRLRPWRKRGPRRRRKRPARLSRRPRLHYNRLRSITLLCARRGAEGSCGSARCEQHAIEHGEYLRRVELALAARTIKPPLRCTAKYFHLDSEESLPLNINIFKNCFQAEATCPFQALRTSPLRCVSAVFVCSISLLCATQSSVKLCMRFYHMAPWVPFEDASSSAATKRSHKR